VQVLKKQVVGNEPVIKYATTAKKHSGIRRIGMKSQKSFAKKYGETR